MSISVFIPDYKFVAGDWQYVMSSTFPQTILKTISRKCCNKSSIL